MKKLTMLDYVYMANDRMDKNLKRSEEITVGLVGEFVASRAKAVRLIASGSSHNGAVCARPFMQAVLGMQVIVVTPGAYIDFEHTYPSDTFEIFISQSGYSTNVLAALDFARKRSVHTVVLTGNVGAPVADHSDVTFDYGVGVESVDFVTMGVEMLALFLMLFSVHAARALGLLDRFGAEERVSGLRGSVQVHARALEVARLFVEGERLTLARQTPVILVGNGGNLGVCEEGALKFSETLKRSSSFYEGEEFVHGPEMQITPNYLVLIIDDPEGSVRMHNVFSALRKVCSGTFLLTSRPMGVAGEICMPELAEPLASAIPALAVIQVVCATLAQELNSWDVHPFLEAVGDEFDVKSPGYDDAVKSLENQAMEQYGLQG